MINTSPVLTSESDGIAVITFNRPDRRNAWTVHMQAAYFGALEKFANDSTVRVIIVTGADRSFCPGADTQALTIYTETGTTNPLADDIRQHEWFPATIDKPMIAAIEGPCAGVGFAHALMCDIRVAAADARFSTAFARRGLPAMHGAEWLLERVAGASVAHDLLLTGRTFSGADASRYGVVTEVTEGCTPLERAQEIARDIAKNCSPASMAQLKGQLWSNRDRSLSEAINRVDAIIDGFLSSSDFAEGIASFVERREPKFSGLEVDRDHTPRRNS